ncbi:MAG: DUF460 domain-containing protein, partial [Crenarchaeota archaeon]|nr:DUF460 domain-containing protein [Thermoproteota archaeon]
RRYQRRVRASILRAVKDIKRALDRSGIDYDLVFRKSGGGLDSAVFVVYAPRSRLKGIVKRHEDNDVRIEIEPVYRSRLAFEEAPAAEAKPYLIVGLDPGISTGIVALDLTGRPVLAVTRRGVDRGEVVELIRSHGVPLVVASDVTPAPDFVKKLAAMLRAQLYTPPQPLPVEEKRLILEEYLRRYPQLKRVATPHVRDALAAAVKALHYYDGKLRQVESHIARLGVDIDIEKLKAAVIRGTSVAEAVEAVIKEMLSEPPPPPPQEKKPAPAQRQNGCGELVERLRAENHVLQSRVQQLQEELKRLEGELRILTAELRESLERDREVAMLRQRLATLQEELEKLRAEKKRLEEEKASLLDALYAASLGQLLPAPTADEIDGDVVDYISALASRYGRLLLVVDRVNPVSVERHAETLARSLVALLAPRDQLPRARSLEEHGLPLLPAEDYVSARLDGTALLDPTVLPDAYRRKMEIEEEKRRREMEARKTLSAAELRRMLEEYRSRRARLLLKKEGVKAS